MKKLLVLLAIFALCATSCSDNFLNLSPKDQPSSTTYFLTASGLEQALTATYAPLRDLLVNDFYTGELRSDNTHYEYNPSNRGTAIVFREQVADFNNKPDNNYVNAVYYHLYKTISRANTVIDRAALATEVDESTKARIVGEAKFLRAFSYFKLVRYFGGVPLYLKEVASSSDAFVPRSSVDEVYQQILSDATDAHQSLSKPAKFPQSGRATKGSATMLLADIYTELKRYSDAEALLRTLPAMGYQLLPDYSDVFSTSNKNSRESIFEVQYQQGLQGGQHSDLIYRFLPRSKNTGIITGVASDNGGIGGWGTPTDDLINAYEPGDLRLDASIGIAEGNYNASYDFVFSANKSVINYTPADGKMGIPYIKKYVTPHVEKNNTDNNWPIYRYSEALLLLAECLNEQGKTTEALTPLNQVRNRAGLSNISGVSQDDLRKIILHERRVELAFENHRWHDLVRSGRAVEIMNKYGSELKKEHTYLLPHTYQVKEYMLLYPIPQFEIEIDPEGLTQNPGY